MIEVSGYMAALRRQADWPMRYPEVLHRDQYVCLIEFSPLLIPTSALMFYAFFHSS